VTSDEVSRLGLGLETRLETQFCESQSQRIQISVTACCLESLNIAKNWLGKSGKKLL